jgi:hypothetical protein
MQDTDLFQLALGLSSPWTVTRSEFDAVDGHRVAGRLDGRWRNLGVKQEIETPRTPRRREGHDLVTFAPTS